MDCDHSNLFQKILDIEKSLKSNSDFELKDFFRNMAIHYLLTPKGFFLLLDVIQQVNRGISVEDSVKKYIDYESN